MEFRWYCKQKIEQFPMDPKNETERLFEHGSFLSNQEVSHSERENGSGGCFGTGPGEKEVCYRV